jgi:DNA-binding NtrC family response regulator
MTVLQKTPAAAAAATESEAWILVVDDEPEPRETLQSIISEKGYHVETAATGQEALEKARRRFFHLAILDVRLPDMNGTELLVLLKERQPDTVCIVVTGYASLQTSIRAVNGGAFAYMLKPLDIDYLLTAMEQALDRQRSIFESRRLLQESLERVRELESREVQLVAQVQRLEHELATRPSPDA